jgi:hypothetical protein
MKLDIKMPPVTVEEDAAMGRIEKEEEILARVESVETPGRPSLDVAIEIAGNLRPRLTSLLDRLRSWDLRSLDGGMATEFSGRVGDVRNDFDDLVEKLHGLKEIGFVAKTTAKTRILAKLAVGTRVELLEEHAVDVRKFYPNEVMINLVVQMVGERKVMLGVDGGPSIGMYPITKIRVK